MSEAMTKAEIKKLDKAWSLKVRSQGHCTLCPKTNNLNPHHYVGRRNRNVRWDLDNGVCLCSGCHTMKTQSAHQDPEWFREQILAIRGQEWLDALIERSRIDCMANKQDFDEIMLALIC